MGDGLLASDDQIEVLENQPDDSNVYGEPVDNWVVVATGVGSAHPLNGPEYLNQNTSQYTMDRDTTLIRKKLISEDPALFSLNQLHRVRLNGSEVMQVDGHPQLFKWFGSDDHVECYLRSVEG
jgi:hypothetical protein